MKVSVIIPVYNVELYVEQCLRSVMEQTLDDIEIICIEDAGTDGSKDIIRRLMNEDSRIQLFINEKNEGLASVRNQGIDRAKGEYIYFLDSDDMIKKNALEALYNRAEEDKLDACIFSAEFIYENEELRQKFSSNPAVYKGTYPDVMKGKELYKKWMEVWDWMPSQPRYFYRRDFLIENNIRFIDGLLHEDESFAFDVLMNAQRVRIINEAYFIRRFRASSIMSSTPTMKNVESCIEILNHVNSYSLSEDSATQFYMYKLFNDVVRKFRAVKLSGQSIEPSEDILKSDYKRELFEAIQKKAYVELYSCSSYYQVMIALMKAMADGIVIDIVLEKHGIETAEELSYRLISFAKDYVGRVFVCPDSAEVDPYEQKNTADNSDLSDKLCHHVDEIMKTDIVSYDRINVFWDLGYIGTYLNIKKIKYTLHEDSLNSYKFIKQNRPNYSYIFDEEKRLSHKGVIPFGYSPYCDSVEVNEISDIQIPHDKVHECSREKLTDGLSSEQRKLVFRVFISEEFCMAEDNETGKTLLLLTEPFAVTGRLPDEESQIKLYRELIEKYGSDRTVMVKSHPRDNVDYKKYFPKITVIEKNMPMEVMNFDDRVHFDTALTVTSSAINGLKNVDEKIYLGVDFLTSWKGKNL